MLGELEARVAAGELSLRGVNENVVEVDEKLLLNVNTRMDLIAAAVADWARAREDVRAVVVVGSQARTDTPADRWSDLDVAPLRRRSASSWPTTRPGSRSSATPVLTFLEPTAFGDRVERRVLYESGEDVDFPLLDASAWRQFASLPEATWSLRSAAIACCTTSSASRPSSTSVAAAGRHGAARRRPPSRSSRATSGTTRSGPRRSSAVARCYTAIGCLDGYLKARLVTLLDWHARPSIRRSTRGTAAASSSAGPIRARSSRSSARIAHYDLRDVARALWETIDLLQALEEETARRLGLAVELDHADLQAARRGGRSRSEARGYAVTVTRALLVLVALALVAGCGGDDETTTQARRLLAARRHRCGR